MAFELFPPVILLKVQAIMLEIFTIYKRKVDEAGKRHPDVVNKA